MKSAVFHAAFVAVSLSALVSFGQSSCSTGGDPQQGPVYPDGPISPYFNGLGDSYFPPQPLAESALAAPQTTSAASIAPQAGPAARIRVVSAGPAAPPIASSTNDRPAAKLTIVAADAPEPIEPPAPAVVATDDGEETSPLDSSIAALSGTWKAVARQGDGELTTIELHLDSRGWAELTVPGSDGTPSTTKSRVKFEDLELKLASADKVVSLGKLVDFNTRQMVLERPEGQVTFVRL
jgi:hypothetical protein